MPRVLVTEGPSRGAVFVLADGVIIGRGADNPIQILDQQISRSHARFIKTTKGFEIEDLGSRNGVLVNGRRVSRTALAPGDVIQLGDTVLIYEPNFDLKTDVSDATVVIYPPDPSAVSSVVRKTLDASRPDAVTEPTDDTLEALRAAHRRLKAVYEVNRIVSEGSEMPDLLQALLRTVLGALGRGVGTILLRTNGPESLEPVATLAIGDEKRELPISRTVLRMVMEEMKGVLSSDAIKDPRFAKSHSITLHGIRSVLCAPLVSHGRAIGALLVQSTKSVAAFSEEDLALLVAVCGPTAIAIENARVLNDLRRQNAALRAVVRGGVEIIGASTGLRGALRMAEKVAQSNATVLLQGETGVGKELFAAFIHERSLRRQMPFVCVNCTAIPDTLLESELFGHEKGAFTGAERSKVGLFEMANGGTLFLDEIGDISPAMQAKLLRAIDQKIFYRVGAVKPTRVDVRIICATSRDLETAVLEKKFRQDLYYRIAVLPIHLPPLRERKEDIPLLVRHFLKQFATKMGKQIKEIEPDAMAALCEYSWPGNVRELLNAIERAVILCEGVTIQRHHLPQLADSVREATPIQDIDMPLAEKVARLERACIEKALREAKGCKAEAARRLHISRPTLDKKIKEYSLEL